MVTVPHVAQSMSWAMPMICVSGEGWVDMGETVKMTVSRFRCPEGLASPLPPWKFIAERVTNWIANENYRKLICSSQSKIKLVVLFLTCLSCMYMQHRLYVTWAVYIFLFSFVNYSKKQDTIWVDEQAKYERDCGGSHPLQWFVFSSQ